MLTKTYFPKQKLLQCSSILCWIVFAMCCSVCMTACISATSVQQQLPARLHADHAKGPHAADPRHGQAPQNCFAWAVPGRTHICPPCVSLCGPTAHPSPQNTTAVACVHTTTHPVHTTRGLTGWNLRAFCLYACLICFLSELRDTPRMS